MEKDVLHIDPAGHVHVYGENFRRIIEQKKKARKINVDEELEDASDQPIDETLWAESDDDDDDSDEDSSFGQSRSPSPPPRQKKKPIADPKAHYAQPGHGRKGKAKRQSPRNSRSRSKGPTTAKGKAGATFRKSLEHAHKAADDRIHRRWMKKAKKALKRKIKEKNHYQEKRRNLMTGLWLGYMKTVGDLENITPEKYWRSSTIKDHTELFLLRLVQASKGRDGGPIRSTTLTKWAREFTELIGLYAVDKTEKHVGPEILKNGLFKKIQRRVGWLIDKFKLNRHPAPRAYLSQRDLQAMFEAGFSNTEDSGRESFIQTVLAAVIAFHTGVRVGSMAAGNPDYLEAGHYIKLEDVDIKVVKKGVWDIIIHIKHRKGYNEADDAGQTIDFNLSHVTKAHNLWFDVGTLLVTLLVLRGAIKDCESLEDAFKYEGQHMVIKEKNRQDPLFRARSAKGTSLLATAATTDGLLESLTRLGHNIGLPISNFHAIRRDAANVFGIIFGAEVGRRLLAHAEGETTFDRNYSRGAWNVDVVSARLGELDHTLGVANQISIMRHRKESMVVDALLNTEKAIDPEGLTDTQIKAIKTHPDVIMIEYLLDETWNRYFALLPKSARINYERSLQSLHAIKNHVAKSTEYKANQAAADELALEIQEIGAERVKIVRQVTRKVRRISVPARRKAFKEAIVGHRPEEQQRVDDALRKPSLLFEADIPADAENIRDVYQENFGLRPPNKAFMNPSFGKGLLTDDCLKELQRPDIVTFIQTHGDRLEDEGIGDDAELDIDWAELGNKSPEPARVPRPEGDRDLELFQEEPLDSFDDNNDTQVVDVDMVAARKLFATRLAAPVYRERQEALHFKENGNKWVCGLCEARGWLKDDPEVKAYSRANLKRHQMDVHSPWDDLLIAMLTDEEGVLQCPEPTCDFIDDSRDPETVRDHCLTECEAKETYQRIKLACAKTREHGKEASLEARKAARRLADGCEWSDKAIMALESIESATDKELEALARKFKVSDPEWDLKLPLLRTMLKNGAYALERSTVMVKGKEQKKAIVTNPHAGKSTTEVLNEIMTPEDEAWIAKEFSKVQIPAKLPRRWPDIKFDEAKLSPTAELSPFEESEEEEFDFEGQSESAESC